MKKIVYFSILLLLTACGGSSYTYEKNPVDDFIRDMSAEKVFTIILHDMDVVEDGFSNVYKHQYRIITEKDTVPQEKITDWMEVGEEFFIQNENNMGMEIAAKTADGKVSKTASPAGFSNYVGNEQYGQWKTNSTGDSFWEFYGKYAMFSSMLNLMTYPVYQSHFSDYRSNYAYRQPYYGSGGSSSYGTNSPMNKDRKSSSTWFSKSSNQDFKSRVQSRTSQSSRSGSRYSRSTTRSRSSSSFGK